MATERIQISIDRFGRVVLPKGIRDRLGITAGTEFEVEETEDAILLKPVQKQARVIDKGGWVVFSVGQPVTLETVNEAIRRARRENREKW